VQRIDVVGRFDHVVLLVTAQTVLRAEGCGKSQRRQSRKRIE